MIGARLRDSRLWARTLRPLAYRVRGFPEPEMRLLPLLVDPARAAIDVGAHAGSYTAELTRLTRRVIAIEPDPASARRLAASFPDVRVIAAAASAGVGPATLYCPPDQPGLGTLERGIGRDAPGICVPAIALDTIDAGDVGFIKIDVEGHELSVLEGARSLLRDCRPALLIEAEARHRANAVASLADWLAPFGYNGLYLDAGRLRPIARFDCARDQHAGDAPANGPRFARYINNFLFVG